jgi:dUTP pyrophosphatase
MYWRLRRLLMKLRYARLEDDALLPFRKHDTDAGMDFYSNYMYTIPPHTSIIAKTGISVEIPEGYFMLIMPKSKNHHLIGAGVIDSYYQPGEILVKIVNYSDEQLFINYHDPIAQGILIPIITPELEETTIEDLKNNSDRSSTGGILTISSIVEEI